MVSGALGTSTWGPKPPYVPQLGPCVSQLGPSRPIFGPTRRPRGLPSRFWSDFGPLREALEAPKHCKIQGFCCISRSATDIVQIVQISPLEGSKRPPRGAQERPGTPQERPSQAIFEPPAGRFCTLRGLIFVQFSFLGKHSQSCPVDKACASLRPAPLYLLV